MPDDLAQARFVRSWSAFIDHWVNRTVFSRGGKRHEADDVRQAAYLQGWDGFLEWQSLPEEERTDVAARRIIARKVHDGIAMQWRKLRKRRYDGKRAQLLWASLNESPSGGYVRTRLEAQSRALVDYHVSTEGLVHSHHGLVRQDTRMLRDEVRERLSFAVQKLRPELRSLIKALYVEGHTIRTLAETTGRSRSGLCRLHREALDLIKAEMIEFASVLSARNTGHSLSDTPTNGDAPT